MNPVAANPDPTGSTSPSLLEGLWRRELGAWERLARLYGPLVYGWCRRKGLQDRDAEDIVQEVFLTVARRIGDFHHDSAGDTFRGWLWTITRNKLGDWIRGQRKREQPLGRADLAQPEELDNPPDDAAGGELALLCRRAVDSIRAEFADRTWHAFWRVVVENQAAEEVAASLGMTRNALYLAKSRVLRRLREVMGEVSGP
jgi:RNA polymerase sigma-70 factor (ECF subfamily)